MGRVGILVQGYDGNSTITLLRHTIVTVGKEFIMGNKNDHNNPFRWHTVRLNLPSGGDYTPSYPWVSKVSKIVNVVIEVFIYVDDMRSMGWCNRDCWNSVM